ncbi:40S ribosomal protein S21 [Ameca splendens]|uniref:Small ribosomal subunit protein eS21 n=1 Tax=Ameca splendens TaxID=208324 RepID=A0ABV0YB81_9TELE
MQNDAGEFVDLYVPRKCSASNRIIGAKDHASIQINIAEVDKVTGRFNGQSKTYAICGAIRRMKGNLACKLTAAMAATHSSRESDVSVAIRETQQSQEKKGESDDSILRLAKTDGVVAKNF